MTGRRMRTVAVPLFMLLAVTSGAAYGAAPTAAEIAVCNRDADESVKARSAFPNPKDEARADAERRREERPDAIDSARQAVQSSDPQIHGMDGAGAKNSAYQAAYRTCMRRNGF
jgi:hypothetical protein